MVEKKLRVPEDRAAKAMAQLAPPGPPGDADTRLWNNLNEHVKVFESEVRADTRKRIAYLIRAELVCCDIYDKLAAPLDRLPPKTKVNSLAWHEAMADFTDLKEAAQKDHSYHDICYFGEWSARLAETGDLPEHVFYGPSDEYPGGPRANNPRQKPDPRND